MNRILSLAAGAALVLSGVAAAAPAPPESKVDAPKSAPPAFTTVGKVDAEKGTVELVSFEKVPVQQTVTVNETVNVNGQVKLVPVARTVTTYQTVMRSTLWSAKG